MHRSRGRQPGARPAAPSSLAGPCHRPAAHRRAPSTRGHWLTEDRLHWVRDMDYDQDRSQVRTASGPRIMASLRNLVITILRLAGTTSIAAALRYHDRRPSRPLQTIMKC